jgi:4-hydroxythreonine-4-phosphate dehydrogenase
MKVKPLLAITMGDAAGIGPEIILKALQNPEVKKACRVLIIGEYSVFKQIANKLGVNSDWQLCQEPPFDFTGAIGILDVHTLKKLPAFGKVQKSCGISALTSIETAVNLALNKKVAGIVTAPLNKEILKKAGCSHHGHTEILAELTHTKKFGMAFTGGGLRIILTTIHEPLAKVPGLITKERVLESILLAYRASKELGINNPHIGVAGLNPHAGENGMFGNEEIISIIPAIKTARKKKIRVTGPVPPDTFFHRTLQGEFDFVVAMYHDQALIPLKTLDFYGGVNITIGLPIVRTSPDHGTAYNIAGKGVANPSSMIAALLTAVKLAQNRGLA